MKRLNTTIITAALLLVGVFLLPGSTVLASPAEDMQKGVNCISDGNCVNSGSSQSFGSVVSKGINVFLFVIGALSVIMIVYGGFKYVTSGGESSALTSAKNTILYAIVGLVVALLAYVIVSFVTTKL